MSVWKESQEKSFYEATSRERANYLADENTFHELISPIDEMTSPHLPVLGEAVSFDDGVVTGVGKMCGRPVFMISQEGKFIGGAVGEVGGAKIVGAFKLALELYKKIKKKYPKDYESRIPAVVFSFETGGVRLHEANAGLLAHAEVMEVIQECRGRLPVISLVGSKVGCFGGMGFVCVATDVVIMSDLGRIGLTGPEVIEEVMGKKEFDSADRALIYRTTGGKHKYIMGDCAYLVKDSIGAFRYQIEQVLQMPYEEIQKLRSIGTAELVEEQLQLVALAAELNPKDARDVWEYFGNEEPERIPDMFYDEFMQEVKIRQRGGI
ncbi:MAG: biotin-independent malonate decarboxylase subunit beta [Lachnospiraceae bacterium]